MAKRIRTVPVHHVSHREWRRRLHDLIPNLNTRCGGVAEAVAVDWSRVTCEACIETMKARDFDANPAQSMIATVFHVEGVFPEDRV